MRTDDFDFDLPPEFIAQHPIVPRDAARLLQVGTRLGDYAVRDLPALLRPGDVMVFNDTRVIPARLTGRRGAARVEVTLHKPDGPGAEAPGAAGGALAGGTRWRALARPARRLRPGDLVTFAPGFAAEVLGRGERGEVSLAFNLGGAALRDALEAHGVMPLPPYIRRPAGADPRDRSDYQTVYAAREGAVAAPTAGLHFTPELLAALDERGVVRVTVTLHVGAGTFLPVTVEDPREHILHSEFGELGAEAARRINATRAAGGRVVAVGTTALRLLESAADDRGWLSPFRAETGIFILPGYRFRVVDLLMTNFHLPRSTLFMLVCAFAGTGRMTAAYGHAKAAGYRFYSYGDACLLDRAEAA